MAYQDRISIDPAIRGGKPCIKDTRINVHNILASDDDKAALEFAAAARASKLAGSAAR